MSDGSPLPDPGGFLEHDGPLLIGDDGVIAIRADARHENRSGKVMGGFLATLADAAVSQAVRDEADGEAKVSRAR